MEEEASELEIEQGEEHKGQADALIVFGFGIKDPNWMQKQKESEAAGLGAESVTDKSEGWMLSLGAKMRVQAAAELYLRGATRDVIFTGGATRTKDGIEETEAEVMQEYFLHILRKRKFEQLKGDLKELSDTDKRDIENACDVYIENAKGNVIKEDSATNTIQNFSRTLSMFDQNPDKYKSVALLSNRFHMARIGQLAEQFLLKGRKFNAEDVIMATRLDKRHGSMVADTLDSYTDANNNESYRNFLIAENRWSRGLAEVPEYFLPDTIHVKGERFREILRNIAKAEFKYEEKLKEIGIDPDKMDEYSEEELREKVATIKRELAPEQWNSVSGGY